MFTFFHHHPRVFFLAIGPWPSAWFSRGKLDPASLVYIAEPHYSQILCLQICLLANIYLSPPNQYSWGFPGHSWRCMEWWKTCVAQRARPSWGGTRRRFTLLFQLSKRKQASFSWSIWCHIFRIFCAVCWCFHCLKWSLSKMQKFSPAFLSTRRLCHALERKYVLDKPHSGLTYSAVSHEFQDNEPTIYSK